MKYYLIFIILFSSELLFSQNDTNDYEKLITNNLKSLSIAKKNKNKTSTSKALSDITINQQLLDSLMFYQFYEYQKYTDLYKSNLDSNEINLVYGTNNLNKILIQIFNDLNKSDTNKITNKINIPVLSCNLQSKFNSSNNSNTSNDISIELDNLTCFPFTVAIIVTNAKSNTVLNKSIFKINPITTSYFNYLCNASNIESINIIQIYKYINTDLNQYYIYKKNNNFIVDGSLIINSILKLSTNDLKNDLMTDELNKIFK